MMTNSKTGWPRRLRLLAMTKLENFSCKPDPKTIIHLFFLLSIPLLAKDSLAMPELSKGIFSDPFYLIFFLLLISLLPFIAIMSTSFSKIVIVLSLVRQAIGTPQIPPNMVIISLALILTAFSMYPVFNEISKNLEVEALIKEKPQTYFFSMIKAAKEPMRKFLLKHAKEEDKNLFFNLLAKESQANAEPLSSSDFIVLAPAFLISELSLAFQIGFLIYLPFVVIDMTVANLLMALGMQMLSPTTISLPFKILLFVLVDGWRLLVEGLVKV